METQKIQSLIESLLFVSGEPIAIAKLAKVIEVKEEEINQALTALSEKYSKQQSGLFLIKDNKKVQLVSNPENAQIVEQLVKSELSDSLSAAALEVLAIIAYRSPISKMEIESIRGVNCSYTLRNLLMRGLIERNDNPKDSRGYVYETSFDFLKKLGIDSVEKLPDYDILSKDERINSIIESE